MDMDGRDDLGKDFSSFLVSLSVNSGNRTGRPIEAQLSMDANLRRRVRYHTLKQGYLELLKACTYEFLPSISMPLRPLYPHNTSTLKGAVLCTKLVSYRS